MKVTQTSPTAVKLPEEMRSDLGTVSAQTRRSYASLVGEAWEVFRSMGKPLGAARYRKPRATAKPSKDRIAAPTRDA